MALIQINGVDLTTPSEYNLGIMDITESQRNALGTMLIERIAQKKKIQLRYTYLDATSLANVLSKVNPIYFNVTYLDPITNNYKTGSFYCGDRTIGLIDFRNGTPRYKDVSFDLIER